MKISFSTLACPDFSWADIYTMAKDLGFDGIEIRGLGENIYAVKAQPFTESEINGTINTLGRLKLEIPCLSTGCCLKFADKYESNIIEIKEYIVLAKKLNTPFIRILGDLEPEPSGDTVDDNLVVKALRELSAFEKSLGGSDVFLLVESNGVYTDTKRLRSLLDNTACENVAALWDLHHPYRYKGETGTETVSNLGSYIKYTHVKDSIKTKSGSVKYRMIGEGDLPIEEMLGALKDTGYSGYISLEWVKRWSNELEEAGLVFPHFAGYMARYMQVRHKQKIKIVTETDFTATPAREQTIISGKKGTIYPSKSGEGVFPWKKETLINETFPDVLDRVCEEFPDQIAFRYMEQDYCRTYTEFRDDVDMFGMALIKMGVKKGDHVAIWATNVPQWFITFWSTVKIGAVLVTVNTAYKIHEAEYLLKQSDTHTLVMIDGFKDSDYIGTIKEICPELANCKPGQLESKRLPFLKNIITVESKQNGCYEWKEAFKMGRTADMNDRNELDRRRRKINKDDVCNMQYTSGTTGFPKGVMLTHYNVVNNGKSIGDCLDLSTADRMMIQVPMFHCFGMVLAMTSSMTHGTSMYPVSAFSPTKGLKCINDYKLTAFQGVPTMFIAMLEHPDFAKTDLSHVRTGIMAGSPCPVKVMEDVLSKMNMRDICITYGQTESSPAITMSRTEDSVETRVSTVGGAVFGVEVKIVDPETGAELPDETDGELCARGYNIMKGYYKMPEATAAAIDGDNWLHTGDLARRTKDGNYKITGRIKDMIIRGGENIYPKEIEDFLYTYKKVKDVQVIGVPDKQYGEEIMACVVLRDGETATADELKEYVRSHMAKHKVPRYISFVNDFPMNAAGKILKYKMRENAVEQLKLQEAEEIVTA